MRNILLVEDDLPLRELLETILEEKGWGVSALGDAFGVKAQLETGQFDVMVLDMKLPRMSGIALIESLSQHFALLLPVVIMTGHGDKKMAIEALKFGAVDFIEKPFEPSRLIESIEKIFIEKKSQISNFKSSMNIQSSSELTPREQEVAFWASEGNSNEEISMKLSTSSETVKTHLKNIFRKMNISSRHELISRFKKRA